MRTTPGTAAPVTTVEYSAFQQAYDFFNRALFDDTLPHVLVTLPRQPKSRGYFRPNGFNSRARAGTVHELAMNPKYFGARDDTDILSTLVHEMAHVWQQEHGHPSRGAYHNKEWAAKMLDLGLHPSDTGKKGGTMTGQSMSHYIVEGGPFAKAVAKLLKTGFALNWQAGRPTGPGQQKKRREQLAKAASKTKYSCPGCGLNVWAKPDATLLCGECYDGGAGELMRLEPQYGV